MLLAELMYIVRFALPFKPKEIIYLTDSAISLAWCTSDDIKLRPYVLNRAESIRRVIQWTTDIQDPLPIYHIPGNANIADLLTKDRPFDTSIVQRMSEWQAGAAWMHYPTDKMPIKSFNQLVFSHDETLELEKECREKPFTLISTNQSHDSSSTHVHLLDLSQTVLQPITLPPIAEPIVMASTNNSQQLFDFVALGWNKAIRQLANMHKFTAHASHAVHSRANQPSPDCFLCTTPGSQALETQELTRRAELSAFKIETARLLPSLPQAKKDEFKLIDQVLYYVGRLDQANKITVKDLDFSVFLDNKDFQSMIPVVGADSDLFYSFLMNVHLHVRPHAGVEVTVREIMKKMYVFGSYRHIIKKVRNDCTTCSLISKKTVELEMAKHHYTRTLIAPVFYTAQIDIVYGFKAKPFRGSRITIKVYALLFVCLHTSATNALALESIETQSVVNAIERHAARYGMPAELYVDSGSQLAALDQYECSLRDVDMILYDSRGIRVFVATPKAHEHRGRIENKVKLFRSILDRTVLDNKFSFTLLEWETTFAKMANALDDIPIARGNSSNVFDIGSEVLTPNRLKLGRNNFRSIHLGGNFADPSLPSDILDKNRKIMSTFFQTLLDRLHFLQFKPKKWQKSDDRLPKVDDVVLFKYGENNAKVDWKLGRIKSIKKGVASIQFVSKLPRSGKVSLNELDRSFRDVVILFSENELFINSKEYFHQSTSMLICYDI